MKYTSAILRDVSYLCRAITWIILIDDATNDIRELTNRRVQVGLLFHLFFSYEKPWSLLYGYVPSLVSIT